MYKKQRSAASLSWLLNDARKSRASLRANVATLAKGGLMLFPRIRRNRVKYQITDIVNIGMSVWGLFLERYTVCGVSHSSVLLPNLSAVSQFFIK